MYLGHVAPAGRLRSPVAERLARDRPKLRLSLVALMSAMGVLSLTLWAGGVWLVGGLVSLCRTILS